MFLSNEQTVVVEHGRWAAPTFEWVDLPAGPQPLPGWARGVDVSWMDGYHNAPHYTVRTDRGLRDWPDKVFTKEGPRYLALSGDGRAECYYHSGEPALTELRQRQVCYPVSPPQPQSADYHVDLRRDGRWYCSEMKPSGVLWQSAYVGWATPQDEGFGRSNIPVLLDDGRWVMLRGPWHGPTPPGYVDVGGLGVRRPGVPDWQHSGAGCISEDLLCLLLARYQAHLKVARVTQGGRSWIEAAQPWWDRPKSVWLAEGVRP